MNGIVRRTFWTFIHLDVVIAKGEDIGERTVVIAGAVVNCETNMSEGVNASLCSSIEGACIKEVY